MINRQQRNGESYNSYLRRLGDELTNEIAAIDEYIYKLTCMILDEVPMCKELEGALTVFVDKKKKYEEELQEIKMGIVDYVIHN